MPVSRTTKCSSWRSGGSSLAHTETVTSPACVRLTALVRSEARIWRSRLSRRAPQRACPPQSDTRIDPALGRHRGHVVERHFDGVAQIEGLRFQHQPAGVQPAEVDHVVKRPRERFVRCRGAAEIFALLRRQLPVEE